MLCDRSRVAKNYVPCYDPYMHISGMELRVFKPSELRWDLDFKPVKAWPAALPVIYIEENQKALVVAGFDRLGHSKTETEIQALKIDCPINEAMQQLWPSDSLGALEKMRLDKILGQSPPLEFLLEWPLELQNLWDRKQVAPKSLRPLQHLKEWKPQLTSAFLSLELSSSQIRESIDLLCDLKFSGQSWESCAPGTADGTSWVSDLKKARFPQTLSSDRRSADKLAAISWPKGTHARWERQGDQGSLVLQTRFNNQAEWNRFKDGVQKLNLEEVL
jgi:hypothetical protein